MKEIIKKYWIHGVVGCILLIALFIPKTEPEVIDVVASPSIEQENTDTDSNYIYIDLKGYVKNPGVYKLEQDARLFHVVNLAGGLLEEADSLAINLSMELKDEMAIYIPSVYDEMDVVITPIDDVEDSLININQAPRNMLETLPGIGPSTAQNIIDYRDEVGYFNTIEDIMNVPNIGEATFAEIKDSITVEE